MALTPSDVEQMTFSTALRGYDLDEVDDFLDQVVVAIRDLQDELASAKARMTELERGGATVPVPDESAVGRALVAAQEAADKMLEEARTEAEVIVSQARDEAETFEVDRQRRRDEAEAEMAQHRERIADVRRQLAVLATQVADRLDEMDAVIDGMVGGEGDEAESVDAPESETLTFEADAAEPAGVGETSPEESEMSEDADSGDEEKSEAEADTGDEDEDADSDMGDETAEESDGEGATEESTPT